jgi:hypothetical protein
MIQIVIVAVLLAVIALACQDQRRWHCSAPGCDWSAPRDDVAAAKRHEELHSKHKPVLRD